MPHFIQMILPTLPYQKSRRKSYNWRKNMGWRSLPSIDGLLFVVTSRRRWKKWQEHAMPFFLYDTHAKYLYLITPMETTAMRDYYWEKLQSDPQYEKYTPTNFAAFLLEVRDFVMEMPPPWMTAIWKVGGNWGGKRTRSSLLNRRCYINKITYIFCGIRKFLYFCPEIIN